MQLCVSFSFLRHGLFHVNKWEMLVYFFSSSKLGSCHLPNTKKSIEKWGPQDFLPFFTQPHPFFSRSSRFFLPSENKVSIEFTENWLNFSFGTWAGPWSAKCIWPKKRSCFLRLLYYPRIWHSFSLLPRRLLNFCNTFDTSNQSCISSKTANFSNFVLMPTFLTKSIWEGSYSFLFPRCNFVSREDNNVSPSCMPEWLWTSSRKWWRHRHGGEPFCFVPLHHVKSWK